MKAQLYKAFTKNGEGGNPATVICGDEINPADAFLVTREIDSFMTVFVFQSNGGAKFRFFTRRGEIDFCGHGILAGAYFYAAKTNKPEFCVETNARTVKLFVMPDGLVQFQTSGEVQTQEIKDESEVLKILNIRVESVNQHDPFCVASIGSPKLLVPVRSLKDLWQLNLNLPALQRWSAENKVNGVYAYCLETLDEVSQAHARAFNPLFNFEEDAATGVAAGALAAVLARAQILPANFVIEQGDVIEKPCRILVNLEKESIKIGGRISTA